MAVDYLSAINQQGSGLNLTQIVDSLVLAEKAPVESRLKQNIEDKQAAISGYALIASEMQKLKSFAAANKDSTAYSVNSDSSSVSVSIKDQSIASTFSANIAVSSLASAQTIEFTGFSSKSDTINKGTVNIDFGSWSGDQFSQVSTQSIAITSSNNTVSGLAEALSAIEGVNATVTNKGDGNYSLIVNSATGEKNSLRLRVVDDPSDQGLNTKFDTSDNAEQVVAAQNASLNINGVAITRDSNTFSDLIDGYEFKLNSKTTVNASVSASIDPDLAFAKVKDFVDTYNQVFSTIDDLTKVGMDGEASGVLARDVVVSGIKRKLRAIVSDALPGFQDKARYISELGIRTERDGSLSLLENDFKKAFNKEPILFDVMMNSIARSDNPSLTVVHDSDVLQPKGGVYDFVAGSGGGSATLGGVSLSQATLSNGDIKYAGISGDITGLKLQGPINVTSAKVYYGQSFLSSLSDYIDDVVSATGTLAKSQSQANTEINEYNDEQTKLEERIASIRERYMTQFSAMESAVTGFKKTGEFLTGFIDSLNQND